MKSSTRFKKNKKGTKCPNCKKELIFSENFCPQCGQVNDERRLSIKQFFGEFFAGFFSFDTRFFKTILPLLFKPGKIAKSYIEGKRRSFTNPFQLYLHTSILFFLIIGLIANIQKYSNINDIKTEKTEIINDSLVQPSTTSTPDFIRSDKDYKELIRQKLDSILENQNINKQFNNTQFSKSSKDSLFNAIVELALYDIPEYRNKRNNINLIDVGNAVNDLLLYEKYGRSYLEEELQHQNIDLNSSPIQFGNLPDTLGGIRLKRWNDFVKYSERHEHKSSKNALIDLQYPLTGSNLYLYERAQDYNKMKTDSDFRKKYVNSMVSKISIALFFLLPILALFFSLVYIRKPYIYTEHLILIFYTQTVFFILLLLGIILDSILDTDLGIIFGILIFMFYFYKTLRNFYEQGRFKTILKYLFLNLVYLFLSLFGAVVIMAISFFIL